MLFRSFTGSYLPSGDRLHVVEVNVQDEDTHDVGSQILLALACIHLNTPVTVLWWWWEWNRICSWWRPSRSKCPTINLFFATWIAQIPQRKYFNGLVCHAQCDPNGASINSISDSVEMKPLQQASQPDGAKAVVWPGQLFRLVFQRWLRNCDLCIHILMISN